MEIRDNVELSAYTTLGIGGPARHFMQAGDVETVAAGLAWAAGRGMPCFILGGGSNLLVSDAGFPGLVIHCRLRGMREAASQGDSMEVAVSAGEDWDTFVAWTVNRGLAGVECLSGIPGTAGATPVQNVGAYGQEVAETIDAVEVWEIAAAREVRFSPAECKFGYRSSIFNGEARGRYVVTAVHFRLERGAPATLRYPELRLRFGSNGRPGLAEIRAAVREIRRSKAMLLDASEAESRSAGSFFKNPILTLDQLEALSSRAGERPPVFGVVDARRRRIPELAKVPAAWLLERAGFQKGYRPEGSRAGLSSRHVLAIVNYGRASAAEVLALAERMQSAVADRFAIELAMEPERVGF